jgi:hypothetical protein
MNLKTVIPNPCEKCALAEPDTFKCPYVKKCDMGKIYDAIVSQRDADMEVLKPMYEAINKFIGATTRAKGVSFSPGMLGGYIALKEVIKKVVVE